MMKRAILVYFLYQRLNHCINKFGYKAEMIIVYEIGGSYGVTKIGGIPYTAHEAQITLPPLFSIFVLFLCLF